MTHKTGGLRGKLRTLSIVGLVLGMLVTGAVLSLFFLEIEVVGYAQGKLTSEITYDIIGHLDSRVTQLNFEEGDDVESGDVIALLDTTEFDEERIRLEAEIREYEAELEVVRREQPQREYREVEADRGPYAPFVAAGVEQRDLQTGV